MGTNLRKKSSNVQLRGKILLASEHLTIIHPRYSAITVAGQRLAGAYIAQGSRDTASGLAHQVIWPGSGAKPLRSTPPFWAAVPDQLTPSTHRLTPVAEAPGKRAGPQ